MLRTGLSGSTRRAGGGAALAVAAALALSGCQAQSTIVPPHDPDPVVVVETASFAEAEIVGHIYANALSRAGSTVAPRMLAGTRSEVLESVVTGEATFTIGFTGELLRAHDPGAEVTAPDDVYAAMMAALPEGLTAGDPAPAEDRPVYVVTRNTAQVHGLRTMSDLAGRCGEFVLGARGEVLADAALTGAVGAAYDCAFVRQVDLGPDPRAVESALRAGTVGVGVVQSADPVLHPEDMVQLVDDADAVVAQNLVPVFRKGSLSEDQLALVNRISGELTTEDIRDLLLGVEFGTATPIGLADFWLDEHGY